jgi:hypothetical protein
MPVVWFPGDSGQDLAQLAFSAKPPAFFAIE